MNLIENKLSIIMEFLSNKGKRSFFKAKIIDHYLSSERDINLYN